MARRKFITVVTGRGPVLAQVVERFGVWAVVVDLESPNTAFPIHSVTHVPTGRSVMRRASPESSRRLWQKLAEGWPTWWAKAKLGGAPVPAGELLRLLVVSRNSEVVPIRLAHDGSVEEHSFGCRPNEYNGCAERCPTLLAERAAEASRT